jgi:uncharacterized protein YkwD
MLVACVVSACAQQGVAPRAASIPPPTGGYREFARIEAEVLAALNTARSQPAAAASWLEQLLPRFSGNRLTRPNWPTVQTVEGAAAVREAISVLRGQTPVGVLTRDASLAHAARDHAFDQSQTGATGHTGSDGSTTLTRVARYGAWKVSVNENIDYAPMLVGREVIESLLMDDGVPDRGHRRNIFDATSRVVGIACGPHPRYTATCVIVQAGGMMAK